jgi:hypothetical protein
LSRICKNEINMIAAEVIVAGDMMENVEDKTHAMCHT